jgi:hypothetical protein
MNALGRQRGKDVPTITFEMLDHIYGGRTIPCAGARMEKRPYAAALQFGDAIESTSV